MKSVCCVLCLSIGLEVFGIAGSNLHPEKNAPVVLVVPAAEKEAREWPRFLTVDHLDVDKAEAEVLERAGTNLLNEERYLEAIETFSQSIELQPESFQSFWGRGVARFFLSENELAILDFDRATKVDPDKPEAYWFRGLAMRLLSRDGWEEELRKSVEMFREQGTIGDVSDLEKTIESFKE